MNREAALALIAAGTLRQGSLLEYTPGELLVVDHKLANGPRAASPLAPHHIFVAAPFEGTEGNAGRQAWGYYVDERS